MSAERGIVRLDRDGAVAVLTLDNPPVSALSVELIAELRLRLHEVEASEARALVVRSGVPGAFGAGADLKLLEHLDASGYGTYLDDVRASVNELAGLPLVSIAAIDGHALGGGLELALACTFRVAGPRARLGFPEIHLGMLPGAGGTQRLTRLIGRDAALDLLLSGRQLDAAEALRLGLVSRVADSAPDADAKRWAERFAAAAPKATAAILRCVEAAIPYAAAPGATVEDAEARGLFDTDDAREAIAAFVAERRRRGEARP